MTLPCNECGGRCCGPIPLDKKLAKYLSKKYAVPDDSVVARLKGFLFVVKAADHSTCGFLVDGACLIYKHRPEVCRHYGSVPELPCAYLYPDESRRLSQARFDGIKKPAGQ